jgi:hypothetical protein
VKKPINKKLLALACTGALVGGIQSAHAANWLALQGTEPASAAARAKVWGFIQPEYQQTDGTKLQSGPWKGQDAVFNQIRPDLDTDSSFNMLRARIAVRGQNFPLDGKVNYFLMLEAGNNGITKQGGGSVKVTDASITLNHIPGARVRVGEFKYPGSEEGLQAIHVFDYINFTNFTNAQLLERYFDSDGSVAAAGANAPNGGVGAFRDVGVQVFDWFKTGDWEHSYAAMIGNGNGIARGDNDDNKDLYLYWASEKVYGGKGPRRQGLKFFGWYQDGKRTINAGPAQIQGEFDRKRYGVGAKYLKGKFRAGFEWMKADGMIFDGSDGGAVPGSLNNAGTAVASWNVRPEDEADGFYVDFGYYLSNKWTLDVRYDEMNRATETPAAERKFSTWTLGTQYFFNKKTRILVNYEVRDAEAPNLPGSHPANQILDGIDDRIAVQFLAIY